MKKNPLWGPQTIAIHSGDKENPSNGLSSPIYQSATYQFPTAATIAEAMVAQAHPQFYGRFASPNSKQVEATITALEKGEKALVTGSGMAAISLLLLTFLRPGQHLIAPRSLYPTTYNLINQFLRSWQVEATFVDFTDPEQIIQALRPETKMIYSETPANPILSLTDLAAISEIGRQHKILTVTDNTFATPYNQQPLTLGIDLTVHSATKYLAGHSDVVAGVIAGSAKLIDQLWPIHTQLGAVLHPFEAWLLERGLKTFPLRMARHNENGLAIAQFLQQHPKITAVHYPHLPSHPQYTLAQQQMPKGGSGVVSFTLAENEQVLHALLHNLTLFKLAVSLGGVHSLITHPATTISVIQKEEARTSSGVNNTLIRLAIGIEDSVDLIADLATALQ